MNHLPEHPHHHHGVTTSHLLWLATGLTVVYAGVEAGVGWWARSLALVADAGHMANDAAALAVAAVAAWLTRRPASALHSYGFGRAEFLAALVNSLALFVLVAWIAVSAVRRLHDPEPVVGEAVSLAAAAGLAINVGWRGCQALSAQDAEFDVGHVQPTAMLGGVVNLRPLDEGA